MYSRRLFGGEWLWINGWNEDEIPRNTGLSRTSYRNSLQLWVWRTILSAMVTGDPILHRRQARTIIFEFLIESPSDSSLQIRVLPTTSAPCTIFSGFIMMWSLGQGFFINFEAAFDFECGTCYSPSCAKALFDQAYIKIASNGLYDGNAFRIDLARCGLKFQWPGEIWTCGILYIRPTPKETWSAPILFRRIPAHSQSMIR